MYNKELEQMLHSDDFSDRVTAAECAYGLDILVNDEKAIMFVKRWLDKAMA